ncbi:hypothetical protein CEXT_119541 [Caerostris extrusa]|uniref:Uncharacterized protein n=1 Tax=Caerostris extrusa TaxID=172846 RepID=A0AAV4VT15_CAEEX|nr:hypothetical protein CEXT_119541 [Caerostris extrusa]
MLVSMDYLEEKLEAKMMDYQNLMQMTPNPMMAESDILSRNRAFSVFCRCVESHANGTSPKDVKHPFMSTEKGVSKRSDILSRKRLLRYSTDASRLMQMARDTKMLSTHLCQRKRVFRSGARRSSTVTSTPSVPKINYLWNTFPNRSCPAMRAHPPLVLCWPTSRSKLGSLDGNDICEGEHLF